MEITWFLTLPFCLFLNLVAGMDLAPFIRISQCRSMCLQKHSSDGKCNVLHPDLVTCWHSCEVFDLFRKESKLLCKICDWQSCQTVCTFYQTYMVEENEYEPTKLPAPEENKTIHMNNNDVAVLMRKDLQGRWRKEQYICANRYEPLIMKPGDWIIIINRNGAIKHYSWDKWQPQLQSLSSPQDGGPFYQACITWENWQKKQHNKEQIKTSFVVTWQQETGDGIMGNQVADNESAQISLPPGSRYLVRVATDNGPGSYPIIIDTKINAVPIVKESYLIKYPWWFVSFVVITALVYGKLIINVITKKKKKTINTIENENKMEKGSLTETQSSLSCSGSFSSCSYISMPVNAYDQMLQMMRMDINANVETQNANVNTQGTNANAQNANVIQ